MSENEAFVKSIYPEAYVIKYGFWEAQFVVCTISHDRVGKRKLLYPDYAHSAASKEAAWENAAQCLKLKMVAALE